MKAEAVKAGSLFSRSSASGVGKRCSLAGEEEGEEEGDDKDHESLSVAAIGDVSSESGAFLQLLQSRR